MPSRQHLAKVLVRNGYARSVSDAFDKFLSRRSSAFVPRGVMSSYEAVELLSKNGAVPVIAHPGLIKFRANADGLERLVSRLVLAGLRGIEAYYPAHTKYQVSRFIEIAKERNLLVTGGSDFHGKGKPNIEIGVGTGELKVPDSVYSELLKECVS